MPLDDLISEVAGGFLRGLCRLVLELFWEIICRKLGYRTLRLITFGRHEPDEDGWLTATVGLAVLILSIWAITEWIW